MTLSDLKPITWESTPDDWIRVLVCKTFDISSEEYLDMTARQTKPYLDRMYEVLQEEGEVEETENGWEVELVHPIDGIEKVKVQELTNRQLARKNKTFHKYFTDCIGFACKASLTPRQVKSLNLVDVNNIASLVLGDVAEGGGMFQ